LDAFPDAGLGGEGRDAFFDPKRPEKSASRRPVHGYRQPTVLLDPSAALSGPWLFLGVCGAYGSHI